MRRLKRLRASKTAVILAVFLFALAISTLSVLWRSLWTPNVPRMRPNFPLVHTRPGLGVGNDTVPIVHVFMYGCAEYLNHYFWQLRQYNDDVHLVGNPSCQQYGRI
jgi:hypothetical protein